MRSERELAHLAELDQRTVLAVIDKALRGLAFPEPMKNRGIIDLYSERMRKQKQKQIPEIHGETDVGNQTEGLIDLYSERVNRRR